ncbi:MAG: putative Ig domain-containing protein [Pirellula sp.]|nr:putative Ig domain-containing protein [Pirellula sp.]
MILRVTDGRGGFDLQSFRVLVAPLNNTPIITSNPAMVAIAQSPYLYAVRAQDADGDGVSYRLDTAPAGMTINPSSGEVRWVATAGQIGRHSIIVAAEDGHGGTALQSFELQVVANGLNAPPIFISSPRTSIQIGRRYLYAVEAFDPSGDSLSYSLLTAPTGMTISAAGLVQWQPTADQLGDQPVSIQVDDGRGGIIRQDYIVNVASQLVNSGPTIVTSPQNSATLGQMYQYDPQATDADGDSLTWNLRSAPAGMSIDPNRGTIRWTPTSDQLGQQTVELDVLDGQGGTGTQHFTLMVRSGNLPPILLSSPRTHATFGRPYVYEAVAIDPDGDGLTFTLIKSPIGMSLDPATGLLNWVPGTDQLSPHHVELLVTDSRGATVRQSYVVEASKLTEDAPPVITSSPVLTGLVGSTYTYSITANDPENQSLSLALTTGPTNMTIVGSTLQWSPTTSEVGNHRVTLVAMDPAGNRGSQNFTINVRQANRRPEPNGDQLRFATPGKLHQDIVRISDPDGDALVYIIDKAPLGLAVDSRGRISWMPTQNDLGVHDLQITARDPYGLGKFVNYQILVAEDTKAPQVEVKLSNNPVNIGDPVFAMITASDDSFIENISLTFNGVAVAIDSTGRANLPTNANGRFDVVATATDGAGITGRDTVVLSVGISRVDGDPIVTITSPTLSTDLATSLVSALTDIIGTVNDPDLAFYTLSIAPLSGGDFVEIARGTQSVNDGVLGKFDPSILQNDEYYLRLYAVDTGGNDAESQTLVSVAGNLKLGNFSLSFTDMTIPVSGIPITVTRTYDSFNAGYQDDLGYGWRVEMKDTDLRTSVPKTGFEDELIYNAFYDGARVYVTLPGGKREGFTFRPQLAPGLKGSYLGIFYPNFVPDTGNTSSLSVPRSDLFTTDSGEMISVGGGLAYNPASSAFGGNYIVTTKDGIAFEIDGDTGDLLTVADTNDNTLTYTDDGIISSTGQSVVFERDARGRIAAVKDPRGNRVVYQYDSRGDLVSVTNREGNKTRFEYRPDRLHYLEKVIDPLGRTGIRSEYDDDGRLVKLFDANGNAVEMIHDLENSVQTIKDQLGNVTTYEFDNLGNIVREVDALGGTTRRTYADPSDPTLETSITDPLGNTTTLTYDNRGNVLTQKDALGNVTISTYQQITYGNSILAKIQGQAALPFSVPRTTTDPLGNTSRNSYDNRGSLTSIVDPSGLTTAIIYDASGNPTTMNLAGNATQFVYDSAGRVTRQTDALNRATTYTYDTNGNQVTETRTLTTPGGIRSLVTTLEYDKNGRVVSRKDPEGNITRTEYDSAGNKIADIDALGRRTEYRYDERGQLTETIFPDATPSILTDNPRTRTEYDAAGRETARVDELGRRTEFQYDKLGRKTFTIYPDATPGNPLDNPRSQTVYDAAGQAIAQIDERGNRTEFVFDAAGRQTIVRDALDFTTTSTYDNAGRQIAQKDALGRNSQFEFDASGRLLKTIYADNSTTASTYDSAGRLTARTDQAGRVTRYEYDQLGRLTAVMDALSQRTGYQYDEAGNLISQRDANGHVTRYEYDGLGRRITTVLPLGQRSTTEYNVVGNLVRSVDFNGDVITFSYDTRDRLTAKSFPDTSSVQFTYNSVGLRQTYVDSRGTTQYVYDERDRLVSRTDPDGRGVNYTYDVASNRTSLTTPAGTTSFTFDALNRLDTVIDPQSGLTDYTYDTVSNLIRTDLPNGTRETRTYDNLSRLTFLEKRGASGVISSYRYTLSPTGRRDAVQEDTGRRVNYSYDGLDRLTREAITDTAFGDRTFDYTYDPVGNRLTRNDSVEGLTNYSYDDNDRLITEDLAGQIARYTYDNNGNTLSRQSPSEHVIYDWDFENRLVSVDTNGDGTVDVRNQYDAEGIRVAQTISAAETRFLIDSVQPYAQVAMEYTPGGIIKVSYVHGNDLISQNRDGARSFYHVDGLGSTRALSDASGIVTDAYVYEAFGRTIRQVGSTENLYLFAGEQRDAATGLDYLRARWMDTHLGVFLGRDAFHGFVTNPVTLHKYIYANSNPIMNSDPTGLFTLLGVTSGQIETASLRILGMKVAEGAFGNVLIGAMLRTFTSVANGDKDKIRKILDLKEVGKDFAIGATISIVFHGIALFHAAKAFKSANFDDVLSPNPYLIDFLKVELNRISHVAKLGEDVVGFLENTINVINDLNDD